MQVRVTLVLLVLVPVHSSFGSLNVRVTRSGQPVANATVCVGTAPDGNLFCQRPSCPTTPAGPQRTLAPLDFTLPTAPTVTRVQLQNNQRCFGAIGA